MTRPVRPEKSMATREFSDALRCEEERQVGEEGERQRSEVKHARHTHWAVTNPVCTQTHKRHGGEAQDCSSVFLKVF